MERLVVDQIPPEEQPSWWGVARELDGSGRSFGHWLVASRHDPSRVVECSLRYVAELPVDHPVSVSASEGDESQIFYAIVEESPEGETAVDGSVYRYVELEIFEDPRELLRFDLDFVQLVRPSDDLSDFEVIAYLMLPS